MFLENIFKKFFLIPIFFSVIITFLCIFLVEKKYTSTAKIIPINQSNIVSSGNTTVQGLLGINMGDGGVNNLSSSTYFHLILKSDSVIKKLMMMNLGENHNNKLLIEHYLKKDISNISNQQIDDAVNDFKNKYIHLDKDRISNLISLNIIYRDPLIAQEVAQFLINETIEIQRKSNKEYSDNRKNYLNQRIVSVRKDLNFSEQKLIDFKSSNNNIVSEYLKIEYERLQREKRLLEQILMTLMEELERTKIKENTDNNEIQILDHPSLATSKSSPRGSIILLFSFSIIFLLQFILSLYKNELIELLKSIESPQ